jgi:uncharacterized membrane protein
MDASTFFKRLWALWLAVPATVLNYWVVGSHLPARIAVHYDAGGQPTHWASPHQVRTFALEVLVFVLVVVTAGGYLVAGTKPDRAGSSLVALYFVVGVVWLLLNGIAWSSFVH